MAVRVLDSIKTYGAPRKRGAPAHKAFLVRTRPKDIPPSTMVLVEREWLRLRTQFQDRTTVPFLERIEDNDLVVHPNRYALAVVFNRNVLRPKNIEPLYEAYRLAVLGQLIIPVTTEGTLVLARKTNQKGQYSGFGAVFDLTERAEERIPYTEIVRDSLEQETPELSDVTNVRVLGAVRFDQGDRRGVDVCIVAESRFSEQEWREHFAGSDQFAPELLFLEPTPDGILAAFASIEDGATRFSPSAIATIALYLRAYHGAEAAEGFRAAVAKQGYPLRDV